MRVLLMLIFIGAAIRHPAQEIHFSQFNEHHPLVNPALTGATDPFRAVVGYRSQWRSVSVPFISMGLSFETRLNSSGWQAVDKHRNMTFRERSVGRIAWGLSVFNDRAGSGRMGTTQAHLSVTSFIPTGGKSFLSVGLQGGITQRNLENGRLLFSSQFDGYGYNSTMPQNEKLNALVYSYFSYGAGILWCYGYEQKRISSSGQLRGNAGLSVSGLGDGRASFYFATVPVSPRIAAHGEMLYVPADASFGLQPSFMIQLRGTASEVLFGTMVRHYLSDNSKYTGIVKRSSVAWGAYYRNNDAFIAMLSVELQEQYVFGISYDINASSLNGASSGRGATELTLKYTPPKAFLYQKKGKAE